MGGESAARAENKHGTVRNGQGAGRQYQLGTESGTSAGNPKPEALALFRSVPDSVPIHSGLAPYVIRTQPFLTQGSSDSANFPSSSGV